MKENRKVGELLYSDTILSGFVAIGPVGYSQNRFTNRLCIRKARNVVLCNLATLLRGF